MRIPSGLAYVAVANLLPAGLGAIFWFVLASFLGAEQYGLLNYYIAIANVASVVALFGFSTAVTTYVAKGVESIKYQSNLITLISSVAGALILLAFTSNTMLAVLLIGIVFFSMSTAELLGKKNYREFMIITIVSKAIQIVLALALYFLIGLDGVLLGYAVGFLALSYRYFWSFSGFKLQFHQIREHIRFIAHSFGLGIVRMLGLSLDKLIIAPLFGFALLGHYQLALQFLMALSILPASLFSYLLPEESSGIDRRKLKQVGLFLSLIFAALSFFAGPWIIKMLFPNFLDAIIPTQIMSIGIIPMSLISILNSSLLGREKSTPVFVGAAIFIAVQTFLVITLGNIMGMIGLSIAMVAALGAEAAYLVSYVSRN